MPLNCDADALRSWVDSAQLVDITYHRSRQQLWGKFTELLKAGGDFDFDRTLFNSIKSALCRRSDSMSDDIKLAFDTALQELSDAIDAADVGEIVGAGGAVGSEREERKKGRGKKDPKPAALAE